MIKEKAMILPIPPSELKLFWPVEVNIDDNDNNDNKERPIIPPGVIYDFFTTYNLDDIRLDLWELLKHALENPAMPGNTRLSVGDMIFLYEKLNDLITANYILYKMSLTDDDKQDEAEQETHPS